MKPMLATPGPIPAGPEWIYEVKWDGIRAIATVSDTGSVTLSSRNGADLTPAFPEFAALGALRRRAVLDGEIVAFGEDGRPSFDRLTGRLGAVRPQRAAALAAQTPATYVVFDLLELDGRPLLRLPLCERRALLAGLPLPGPATVPEPFDDPAPLLAATAEQGLEGVVAKRRSAPYRPGVRSGDWIKHSHRSTTDAVVVAWRPATSGSIASLALAEAAGAGGPPVFRGTAGSGISQAASRLLLAALRPAAEPDHCIPDPQALAREGFGWASPAVVVEVSHLGLTAAGRFRQPVVVRVRTDLRPAGEPRPDPVTVAVAGRTLRVTHLDKVLYPATGTTKAEVIAYYSAVADRLLALARDRPVTRRRWPEGVGAAGFFEKNLPAWAPDWIRRAELPTSRTPITFPVLAADDRAALIWLAAHSALELHTPQWRVDGAGRPLNPDRLVVDLDPGPGTGMPECATVALVVRDLLRGLGLDPFPVLSGSKGLHLYAALPDAALDADAVTALVSSVADRAGSQLPRLVAVTMARRAREGRVFIDWSQNRAAKTTLAPWSLRGSAEPFAACPIGWDEVADGGLRQLRMDEVLDRLASGQVPPA